MPIRRELSKRNKIRGVGVNSNEFSKVSYLKNRLRRKFARQNTTIKQNKKMSVADKLGDRGVRFAAKRETTGNVAVKLAKFLFD